MFIVQIFQKDGGSTLLGHGFSSLDDAKRVTERRDDVVRAIIYKVSPCILNWFPIDTVAKGTTGGFKWTES